MTQEALKLALKALNSVSPRHLTPLISNARTALREALAEQPAQQDSTCNNTLRAQGKAYPRTCKKCGLGPCIADRVQPARQEPDWKAEYLKSVESGCITLDELREANAELDATNRQVEILSDALAESRREIDALVALARADEREACADLCYQLVDNSRETRFAAAIRARSNT